MSRKIGPIAAGAGVLHIEIDPEKPPLSASLPSSYETYKTAEEDGSSSQGEEERK